MDDSKFSCSVAAKLILFGEWGVLNGHPGVAVALNSKFHLALENQITPVPRLLLENKSPSDPPPFAMPWNPGLAPGKDFLNLAVKILNELWERFELTKEAVSGKTLKLFREWKISEGLGSSSALLVSLYYFALHLAREKNPLKIQEKLKVWEHCLEILRKVQSPRASGLDLATQIFGSCVLLHASIPQTLELQRPENLWLVHTGNKMVTERALSSVELSKTLSDEIGSSTQRFVESSKKASDWKNCMREHHDSLTQLGVVPSEVQDFRTLCLEKNLISELKTTGAGGGDTLMLWAEGENTPELKQEIENRGWYISDHSWESPKNVG